MPAGQLARCTADTYVGVATGSVATEFRIHLHLPLPSCQWSLQVQNKHTHCKSNIGLPVSLDHPALSSTCHLPVLPLCILWVAPPLPPSATQSKHSSHLIIPTHIPKCMLYGCNSPAWWPLVCCYLSSSSSHWSDTAAGDQDPHSCPLMYVSLFLCLQLLQSNQD